MSWLTAHRGPRALVVVAAVVSGVLLASALIIRETVREASHLVARGLGDAFASAGQQAFRGSGALPTDEDLEEFLAIHRDEGLRYVALLDDQRTQLAHAGLAVGSS